MNEVDINLVAVKGEHSGNKPGLRQPKIELLNKLMGDQTSQQMIVTTPLVKTSDTTNENKNLKRSNSLTEAEKSPDIEQSQDNPKSRQNETQKSVKAATNQSLLQQQAERLLPEELRREPVIFSGSRSRWYTNEEVASILTNFAAHPEWQANELQIRPKSGAVLLYSREKVRYRQDGYCWKKRKNGRTTREDHMKLKVQGVECIYGCYVHSAILPTFHRRCYWLLQNPDIVLVHYLNQPPDDQNKMMITFNSALLEADTRRTWTNEEIIEEIGSVFGGISQIHHTLNINFPPDAAIIQQRPQCQTAIDPDKVIEMSPQSPQSQATTSSEAIQEQVDMTILETQRQQRGEKTNSAGHDSREDTNGDELMSIGNDSSVDQSQNGPPTSATSAEGTNQSESSLHQSKQDESINMTFDIVANDRNQSDEYSTIDESMCHQEVLNCFGFSSSSVLGANSSHIEDITIAGNHISTDVTNRQSSNEQQQQHQQQQQLVGQVDQNPCSPVTQIYNKIVDDIETYALPLETGQFDSRHLHHHNVSISGLPIEQIGGETCQQHGHQINHVERSEQQPRQQQHQPTQVQFNNSNDTSDDVDKKQPACSMEFVACDLFSETTQQDTVAGVQQVTRDEDNLLLTDFNLQPTSDVEQVASELDSHVVGTLSNDDLRDLMMGIPSNGNSNQGNLLVDTNSLDLFNFKPSTWDQRRQQLDVKSTTSDTDALSRLSPMDQVPRCNSTGNTMIQISDQLPCQQHHLSNSNFLLSHHQVESSSSNQFNKYQSNTHYRSMSANPSGSTPCSLSPSSLSLRAGTVQPPITSFAGQNSAISDDAQSFMRVTLQQRQKSEQREPSTVVLSGLLPKAVSLDGSDLPNSNGQRLHANQLVGYNEIELGSHRQPNLLLIPASQQANQPPLSSMNTTDQNLNQNRQVSPSLQHMSASLSPNMPIDDSSDLGVNSSIGYERPHYGSSSQLEDMANSQTEFVTQKQSSNLLPILDYVPNWCNITGGAKVIIVGNWKSLIHPNNDTQFEDQQSSRKLSNCDGNDSNGFFALFDNLLVPATLIQDNVLRCYAPGHEPGFINLKVLYMNRVVSEQVLFEMRPSCVQPINQSVNINPRDNNQQGGHDSSNEINNNGSMNQSSNQQQQNQFLPNQQQHRNSTSSNHSTSSSALVNQISQTSISSGQSATKENSKVLTLAENIISAMHKKNNIHKNYGVDYRLVNSLDMECSDNYLHPQHNYFRQNIFRNGSHRRMGGSRSLSRDSEPSSIGYGLNFGFLDNDPYWHRGPNEPEPMQPLTVMTDFITNNRPNNFVFGQKRHSSGSAGLLSHYHSAQLGCSRQSAYNQMGINSGPIVTSSNADCWHSAQTETSSSGLGSVVSSLSPSNSSLHSPSSACATAARESLNASGSSVRDNQSPCSCGRQTLTTPSSADFCEYFQASARTEESFASLTLNDSEQKELYEAAKIIQKAYRTYRGRKRQASELLVDVSPTSDFCLDQSPTPTAFVIQKHAFLQQSMDDSTDCQQVASSEQYVLGPAGGRQQSFYYISQHSKTSKQQPQQAILIKCYRDREMQAATIIQAYYRRYRQYVHYKRQQAAHNNNSGGNQLQSQQQQQTHPSYHKQPQGHKPAALISNSSCERPPAQSNARLVVDTMPIVVDKATTSHVDRKRFKTAMLVSSISNNDTIIAEPSCEE